MLLIHGSLPDENARFLPGTCMLWPHLTSLFIKQHKIIIMYGAIKYTFKAFRIMLVSYYGHLSSKRDYLGCLILDFLKQQDYRMYRSYWPFYPCLSSIIPPMKCNRSTIQTITWWANKTANLHKWNWPSHYDSEAVCAFQNANKVFGVRKVMWYEVTDGKWSIFSKS